MTMVADLVDAIVGVDTHRDTHAVAVCTPTGGVLAELSVPASDDGYVQAIAAARQAAPGPRLRFAIEGARSYGLGLTRAVLGAGYPVIEVEQPSRKARRGRGKSDRIDAVHAARTALGYDAERAPTPRADGAREAARVLLVARRDMTDERTAKVNALKALLVGSPDSDEQALARGALTQARLARIVDLAHNPDPYAEIRRGEARRLARRISDLDVQLKASYTALRRLVADHQPGLLDRVGVGPVSAAQAWVTWSHLGRCRNDAAYATLAGAAPVEATSGQVQVRHRLNRGGDRALNRALHDIVRTRMIHCEDTKAYVARRRAQGRSDAEIRRCLKRYVARQLHRAFTTNSKINSPVGVDNT